MIKLNLPALLFLMVILLLVQQHRQRMLKLLILFALMHAIRKINIAIPRRRNAKINIMITMFAQKTRIVIIFACTANVKLKK